MCFHNIQVNTLVMYLNLYFFKRSLLKFKKGKTERVSYLYYLTFSILNLPQNKNLKKIKIY